MENFINIVYQNLIKYFDKNKVKICKGKSISLNRCISCQSNEYFNHSININYDECIEKKIIYMLRYMPVHFHEIKGIMNLLNSHFFNKEILNVLSIGGGSGIDIMAFNSWIKDNIVFNIREINYTIIDKEEGWNPIFEKNKEIYKLENINITYDIQNILIDEHVNIGKDYDLVIISYFISELDDKTIDVLVDKLKYSKVILINDRRQDILINKILKFKKDYKSECKFYNNEHCNFNYQDEIFYLLKPKIYKKSVGCIIYNDN